MGNMWGRAAARAVAAACLTGGLSAVTIGASAPAAQASDDYPWAWQGQCPIVPQEPIEEPTPTPTPTPTPSPGSGKPDTTATPEVEAPPPPPPVLDPVSGHLYDPRGPRPTCARHVWSIGGSIGDPWGFALRNCTSFVSWRLHEQAGMARFSNYLGGQHWGNADHWDDAARRLGFRVDDVPAIGAVAQTDSGRVGHVAWVSAIGPGTVTVEEYNHSVAGGYGTRTVPVGDFRYLHLADVAPSPLIGSDRPVVSATDGLGGSWTARVDDRGTLWVARPGRDARATGPRGAFSPLAAPALTLAGARPWVAATTRGGRVLAGTVRGRRIVLRDVGTSATTASPALTTSSTGRPVLASTTPGGTLTTRRFTLRHRWSAPARVGAPGSWSTHAAPVLGLDGSGRTLLVAVGRRGSTWSLLLDRGRLTRLAGEAASPTSTPALSTQDGTTRLHQVTASGRLRVLQLDGRRWGRARTIAGDWSPYSSPVVTQVAARLYVAAVGVRGDLLVRPAIPGERSRVPGRIPSSGDPTRSPGLVVRNSGTFVVADTARAPRPHLLARPASAVVRRTAPTRAGFTP